MVRLKEGWSESSLVDRGRSDDRSERWWHHKPGDARALAIMRAIEAAERDQTSRRSMDQLHLQMYAAGNAAGAGMGVAAKWRSSQLVTLRMNLAQQVVDAMQAKIAKLRPRARFVTTGGDWGLQKRAEAMEQVVDGEFSRNRIDDLMPKVAADCFTIGDGFAIVGRRRMGHPVVERCLPGEIVCEYWDGLHGAPRAIHRTHLIDRDYLLQISGAKKNDKLAQVIRNANSSRSSAFPWLPVRPAHSEILLVIESWHLPSYRGADDGAYAITLDGKDITPPDRAKYTDLEFPIVQMQWQPRPAGFWSKGIVEEITPQQIEINYTLEKIQYILHNVSTVRHWVQAGGGVELRAQKMTNTPGEVLKYWGPQPPITDIVSAVPRELFDHIDRLSAQAFAAVGMSQFFATAQKPAGLNSGEAQRVHEDVGSERQMIKGRNYEAAHMQLSRKIVMVKREIAESKDEEESPVVVKAKRARGVTVRSLSFADVQLEDDEYLIEELPQSSLPGTPSGRVATATEWLQMGAIDSDEWRRLLNMPDTKAHGSLLSSTTDNVMSAIELMAEEGEYVTPHAFLDLAKAKRLVALAYSKLEWEGLPEENLELIARYASDLADLEALAMQPQQQMMQPGAMPGMDAAALQAGAGQGAPMMLPQ